MDSPFSVRNPVIIKVIFILFFILGNNIFNVINAFLGRYVNGIFGIYNNNILNIICHHKLSVCTVNNHYIFTVVF